MAGFTNQTEDDILDLTFTNVDAPNWGDGPGLQNSATEGSLYLSLHLTDALTDASVAQTDNETSYTGYARQAVARNVSNWTVSNPNVTNDNLIQFGSMTAGGPVTITDVGIGSAVSGAGYLFIYGQVTSDLIVNNGVNPQFAASALSISLD
jgi:hypothetical protein